MSSKKKAGGASLSRLTVSENYEVNGGAHPAASSAQAEACGYIFRAGKARGRAVREPPLQGFRGQRPYRRARRPPYGQKIRAGFSPALPYQICSWIARVASRPDV